MNGFYDVDYNNYASNRSYPPMTHDYHHQNPWEKPLYPTLHHQSYHPLSFEAMPNLNNTNPNFYRQHGKFFRLSSSDLDIALLSADSSSIYPPSTSHPPSTNAFHYPPGLFFGWNNGSSLMRTHSASYPDYPGSSMFWCSLIKEMRFCILDSYVSYNPTTADKSALNSRVSQMASNTPSYSPFFNLIPPTNYSLPPPPPPPLPSSSISNPLNSHHPPKRSKINKRPRLTAQIRSEILKLKANKPTIFVWEIQQNLLQNGTCTSQTLPNVCSLGSLCLHCFCLFILANSHSTSSY